MAQRNDSASGSYGDCFKYEASTGFEVISPINAELHTMPKDRLREYLRIKIHSLLDRGGWEQIHIEPEHNRARSISSREKNDKMFNWQRPTGKISDSTFIWKCFPGQDYVRHYGLIASTYFDMVYGEAPRVTVAPVSKRAVTDAVSHITIPVEMADLVVVGWGLTNFAGDNGWTQGRGYSWKVCRRGQHSIIYLGFFHSIWGDVAGAVVTRLAKLGARRVVYVGKVGSLDASVEPNCCLATGNKSVLENELVEWPDFFDQGSHDADANIIRGLHISSSSILLETKPWLNSLIEGDFVDPEIGHMGRAAFKAQIEFGYLHVISNNLALERDEDLSNERRSTILLKRSQLLRQIDKTLWATLERKDVREAK